MSFSLEFQDVSKRYHLGNLRSSLRETVPDLARRMFGRQADREDPELWALKDISFAVKPGEALGIIGPNGAGKTTTLKLATHVTKPTRGRIVVEGRLSALIELGAGFHPDLTGRENIYLNGTILGMRRQEIDQRFDEIVAFSELERFLDTPVKRYSSGMYARLGFSVAAHVQPDVLIIDEVLAVGDAAFVSKCYARMSELRQAGTTILLVTHSMGMMQRLCDRALLLYGGQIMLDADPESVIAAYLDNPEYSTNFARTSSWHTQDDETADTGDKPVRITRVTFIDSTGAPTQEFRTGDKMVVRMEYQASTVVHDPAFEFKIHDIAGNKYADHNSQWDNVRVASIGPGRGTVEIAIDDLVLAPGAYDVSLLIADSKALAKYDDHRRRYRIRVKSGRPGTGLVSLPHTWRFDEAVGSIAEPTTAQPASHETLSSQ